MIKYEKTKKLSQSSQKAEAHKLRLQGLPLKKVSLRANKEVDKKQQANKKQSRRQKSSSSTAALKKQKWIEISPYGIVGGMIPSASAVLFKGKHEEERFVVWLSELKSRIAVEQNLNKEKIFDFAHKILSNNNCLPKQCLFVRSSQGRGQVLLYFENSKKPMTFYADEVVCFCMMSECRFFCTEEFLKESSRQEIPKQFRKEALSEKPLYLN